MQYDFTLGAGQAQVLEAKGTYFKYKGGLGPIRVTPSNGGPVDLLPGQGMSGITFDRLTIKDLSGAGNMGFLLAGDGQWSDDRITGTVDVVDGGKTRTLAAKAFSVWASNPGTASLLSVVQLCNPVGSTKNIVLESLTAASTVATGFEVRAGIAESAMAQVFGVSKLLTPVLGASTAYSRSSTLAAVAGNVMFLINAAVRTMAPWKPVEPIVIAPGACISILGQSMAADVSVSFEWYEENISNG